jgi:organic radical activating enzyme
MSNPHQEILENTKKRLDEVSKSFCVAKWTQSTLHLHRGLTHSCHHPKTHKVPLSELDKTPYALHNTEEKIQAREQMMKGERPEECGYCWKIEDLGDSHFSDRILKSKDPWAMPFIEEILADPLSKSVPPRYLEVSFSRACNFRCIYCSPSFSTKWVQEIQKFGPYKSREYEQLPHHLTDPFEEENNPYIEAFWNWWPEMKNSLHTFRITGGEPLLSENTFRIFEELRANPLPNLEFSINTNLGCSNERMEKFENAVMEILHRKAVKKFQIFTSIEALGEKAEYIRNGLNEEVFWKNLTRFLSVNEKLTTTIMVTYNLFSVSSFLPFLKRILELRNAFSKAGEPARVKLDISYLHHPHFLAANILSTDFHAEIQNQLMFMEENRANPQINSRGFYNFEIVKMARLLDWVKQGLNPALSGKLRLDLYEFLQEHDKRRSLEVRKVFPEYSEFLNECEKLAISGRS